MRVRARFWWSCAAAIGMGLALTAGAPTPPVDPSPGVVDNPGFEDGLAGWTVQPTGTEGWRKAEVMAGGVDTHELDSQSMASRRVPALHFIGEVVDVTGWLGGYNFQWAWASGAACARAL